MSEPRPATRKPTRRVAAPETVEDTVSREEIAQRAYEIAHGPEAGSDEENWLRAEHELRGR
jgi:hypothetical protein